MKACNHDDAYILKEIKSGNTETFAFLFTRYYKEVQSYIFPFVNNKMDAEDLMILTFEKAFVKIREYTHLCDFKTWLFTIARNSCFDFLKYKKNRPEDIDISELFHLKSNIENPEDSFIDRESSNLLDISVNELQDSYKEIISLRFYEELSYDEICANLNISSGVARQHILRATRSLNKILTKKIAS